MKQAAASARRERLLLAESEFFIGSPPSLSTCW